MRMLPLICLPLLISGCMIWPKPVGEVQVQQPVVVAPKPVVAKKAAPVVKKRIVPKPVVATMPASERSDAPGRSGPDDAGGWNP